MGPDFDAFMRNQTNWRRESRKARCFRMLKLYGIAASVLICAAVFAVAELSPLLKGGADHDNL